MAFPLPNGTYVTAFEGFTQGNEDNGARNWTQHSSFEGTYLKQVKRTTVTYSTLYS